MALKHQDFTWAAWVAACAGSFAVLERRGLRRDPDGKQHLELTFSATSRNWMGISNGRRGHRLFGMALVVGGSWVVSHILDPHGTKS